jgi:hypothetical protein
LTGKWCTRCLFVGLRPLFPQDVAQLMLPHATGTTKVTGRRTIYRHPRAPIAKRSKDLERVTHEASCSS